MPENNEYQYEDHFDSLSDQISEEELESVPLKRKLQSQSKAQVMIAYLKSVQGGKYVTNEQLLHEYAISIRDGKPSERLVKMLMLILKGYQSKFTYSDAEVAKDVYSEALLHLLTVWNRANLNKSQNLFGFYTRVSFNALCQAWNKVAGKDKYNVPLSSFV